MVGEPLFFVFLMPLIGWRLGGALYYHAKVVGFRDSIERKGKKCRVLSAFAEMGIGVAGNAVVMWAILS